MEPSLSRSMLGPGAREVNRTAPSAISALASERSSSARTAALSPDGGEGSVDGARVLWARGDDEAEAGLGTVVASKGLLDLLAGEPLVLGRGVQQVVEGEPAIVER